jgi:hypothetical protein
MILPNFKNHYCFLFLNEGHSSIGSGMLWRGGQQQKFTTSGFTLSNTKMYHNHYSCICLFYIFFPSLSWRSKCVTCPIFIVHIYSPFPSDHQNVIGMMSLIIWTLDMKGFGEISDHFRVQLGTKELRVTPSILKYLSVLIETQILRNLWRICNKNAQLESNLELNQLSNELFLPKTRLSIKRIKRLLSLSLFKSFNNSTNLK